MRTLYLVLLLSVRPLWAAGTNSPSGRMEITMAGDSPLGTFHIEYHQPTDPNEETVGKEVWLVSSKNPKNRQLLYTYWREVEVIFSDDEKWLVVNDQPVSNISQLLLFHQQKKLEYEQTEDLTDRAWRFAASKMGRKKRPALDHEYVQGIRWTDGHTLLVCLSGDSYRHISINNWLCFYDVATRIFSTDLDKHNQRHTTLDAK
jgi:hypothetical protein